MKRAEFTYKGFRVAWSPILKRWVVSGLKGSGHEGFHLGDFRSKKESREQIDIIGSAPIAPANNPMRRAAQRARRHR